MRAPYAKRLEAGLRHMVELIHAGVEYPDAQWEASKKFTVADAELRDAYDDHCINVDLQRDLED